MAYTTLHTGARSAILHNLAVPFIALGNALVRLGEANSRTKQVAYLQSLSDEDLAKRGITRDEIAHYVFKDVYYV
ncbi:MAG: hypothetical protein OQK00_04345 [Rhodobacteraceae bacterium]|nr:hypothetical protein [Paracoccaceae bacterium]MCW9042908.1 hypothetical protein [Pseudopelagicola sp.]